MRKFTALWLGVMLVLAIPALAALQRYQLKVEGVNCEKCVEAIDKALEKLKGVEVTDVDIEKKSVEVKFDDELTNLDKIKQAIAQAGFKVTEAKPIKKD